MSNFLAFSGSNSSVSINQSMIRYIANHLPTSKVINLTDFDIPLYSYDVEKSIGGLPDGIKDLMELIENAEKIVIATPEHNSSTPAFFKNILDWMSRSGIKYLANKQVFLVSVSTGKGAAKKAADYVEKLLNYAGGDIVQYYHFPSFNENFDLEINEITDQELKQALKSKLALFQAV
jgi:chromate reductase